MARPRGWPPCLGVLLMVGSALSGCAGSSFSGTTYGALPADIAATLRTAPDFQNVRAIIVTHDGRTTFEHYYGTSKDTTRNVASVTKSVLSTLVGIELDQGLIRSLDEPLRELLPAYASDMTPDAAHTTLRRLLTMSAGLPGSFTDQGSPRFTTTPDWVGAIVKSFGHTGHRGDFGYSDADAHLVSAIVEQASGESTLEYARSTLFDPLGIDTRPAAQPLAVAAEAGAYDQAGFAWPVDPQGVNLGSTLIKMRPEDMVRFGQLFLDDGQWKGEEVVSSGWVRAATHTQIRGTGVGPGSGYGYFWWVTKTDGHPAYLAWGYGGQLIEIVPDLRLVVVVSTAFDPVDPTSHGVAGSLVASLVDDTIVPDFTQ